LGTRFINNRITLKKMYMTTFHGKIERKRIILLRYGKNAMSYIFDIWHFHVTQCPTYLFYSFYRHPAKPLRHILD